MFNPAWPKKPVAFRFNLSSEELERRLGGSEELDPAEHPDYDLGPALGRFDGRIFTGEGVSFLVGNYRMHPLFAVTNLLLFCWCAFGAANILQTYREVGTLADQTSVSIALLLGIFVGPLAVSNWLFWRWASSESDRFAARMGAVTVIHLRDE